MEKAAQVFDISEKSVGDGYQIAVSFKGEVIKIFRAKTIGLARQAFKEAGYQPVAEATSARIILRKE